MNKRIKNRQNIIKDYIVGDFFMEKRKLIKFIIIEFLLVSLFRLVALKAHVFHNQKFVPFL